MRLCLSLLVLLSSMLMSCGEKQTEEQLRAQAQQFEKQENFKDALVAYQKQVDIYPDAKYADEAQYKTAFIYYNNLHDFQKAIEAHKKLIERYPDSKYASQARFMIGYIYANDLRDYDKARAAYKEFLEKHPESELVESVKWELDHLGQDINEQLLLNGVGSTNSNGQSKAAN